jgi:4'-phosphopantetheinyl transferase
MLKHNQVHIWCALLESNEEQLNQFFNLLDANEQHRAQRFRFAKDRSHFIISHGILRKLLGHYLKIAPQTLQFGYTKFNKPFLMAYPELQFNLSHSKNIALFAITVNHVIGVDVEYINPACDIDAIAERYFSTREYAVLKMLNGDEKISAFFNGWSRKEAFLKAIGQGLSYSLAKVEVNMQINKPAKLLALDDKNENVSDWLLQALNPLDNYAAALAIKNPLAKIELFKFQQH